MNMSRRTLTEGAQRAIETARRLAAEMRHAETLPVHLLWALLQEESRAFDILSRCGVTPEMLCVPHSGEEAAATEAGRSEPGSAVPADDASNDAPDDDLADLTRAFLSALEGSGSSEAAPAIPAASSYPANNQRLDPTLLRNEAAHGELRDVLQAAHQHVMKAKLEHEVTSEHLLQALLSVPSSASELLSAKGLTLESLRGFSAQEAPPDPVRVDFAIDWDRDVPEHRTAAYRILDASANRAREGLRVVEDYVRFTLDDAHLSRLLKTGRHRLTALLQLLSADLLIAARDTQADVGTTIHTASEMARQSPLDVARASLKRVQEAVRTLEEYSKVVVPAAEPGSEAAALPEQFGHLRYDLYTLEKAVLQATQSQRDLADCQVYLLLTADLCRLDVESVLAAAMQAGVRIVQVREKQMADRALIAHGRKLRELTRAAGVRLIFNDRPDLAVLCDADGVHVGQEELTVRDVRRVVGPDMLIGVSTHSLEQARQAVLDGAGYIGVGPVFSSKTKQFSSGELVGLDLVRAVADEIALPWFAIGGIDSTQIELVRDAGARRIAVSSAICGADQPGPVAAGLVRVLQER